MSDENEEATSEPTIREELAGDLIAYFGEPYALDSDPGPVIMHQHAQADGQVLTTVGLNEDVWSNPTPARCAQLAARTLVRMAEDDAFDTEVAVDDETHELRYRTTVKDDPEIWEKYVQPFHPHNLLPCFHYGLSLLWRYRRYLPINGNQPHTDMLIFTTGNWIGGILDAIDRGEIGTGDDERPLHTRFSDIKAGKDDFLYMLHTVIAARVADPTLEEGQEMPSLESDIQAFASHDNSAMARTMWKLCLNPTEEIVRAIAAAGYVPTLCRFLRDVAFQSMSTRSRNYDANDSAWAPANEAYNQVIDAFVDALAALDDVHE